jgi:hypothetical protein
VAGECLHAVAHRPGADRRRRRRSARPAPRVRCRHRPVRRSLAVVRAEPRRRAADRRAHHPGRRRGAADPQFARDHRRDIRPRRTRQGDRHMGRVLGDLRGVRPSSRRMDRGPHLVAMDLPDQSVHRVARDRNRAAPRSGEPRPRSGARARLGRRTARARRSRQPGLRPDRRARWLERRARDRLACGRRGAAGGLRLRRAARRWYRYRCFPHARSPASTC